jgi:hypothetical protein
VVGRHVSLTNKFVPRAKKGCGTLNYDWGCVYANGIAG